MTFALKKYNNCKIRLMQLNNVTKPSPTKLQGSQNATENSIRRRVANLKKKNGKFNYGPLFGLTKLPTRGGCKEGKTYNSNGGNSSDVTRWRHLYGGSRNIMLAGTKPCPFGCPGAFD